MISKWPKFRDDWRFEAEETATETIKEAVRAVRAIRTSMNVPPSRKAKMIVVSDKKEIRDIFRQGQVFFASLGYASEVAVQKDREGIPEDAVSAVTPDAVICIPFADLVDIDKELERLGKEEERLAKEIARGEGMLSNERFLSKAPEAKVAEEKEKLARYRAAMAQVKERIQTLKK